MELNRERLTLLGHLRNNCRKSLSEISREERIPLQKLIYNLSFLEKNAVKRYFSILDLGIMGYNLKLQFFLKTKKAEELRRFVLGNGNVNSCSCLQNNWFYLECFFRDMKELADFREALSELEVIQSEEHFVTEELKREGFVCECAPSQKR